jgi:hypothetical protein
MVTFAGIDSRSGHATGLHKLERGMPSATQARRTDVQTGEKTRTADQQQQGGEKANGTSKRGTAQGDTPDSALFDVGSFRQKKRRGGWDGRSGNTKPQRRLSRRVHAGHSGRVAACGLEASEERECGGGREKNKQNP